MIKPTKPQTRFEYHPQSVELMKRAALHVRTVLGDLYKDVVIVGGLVPSLLVPNPPDDTMAHPGTMDLDLGLSLGLLEEERYAEVAERLRRAGFAPAKNKDGREIRQTWEFDAGNGRVLVDFLIGPASASSIPGKLQSLEDDFAAFIAEGVPLAFRDQRTIKLTGRTLKDEAATREAIICGPSAFVAMKAVAFKNRGEPKDAYDLFYVLRHYPHFTEIVDGYQSLLSGNGASCAAAGLATLRQDFRTPDAVGTARAVEFALGAGQQARDELRADVSGIVMRFVAEVGE